MLNKIDLPSAEPERVCKEIEEIIGLPADDALKISAKTGFRRQRSSRTASEQGASTRETSSAFASADHRLWFDNYLGVVSLVRVVNGSISRKQKILIMSTGKSYLGKAGGFYAEISDKETLQTGEVGFVVAGIKDIFGAPVGDTITSADRPCQSPCRASNRFNPGYSQGFIRSNPTITRIFGKR